MPNQALDIKSHVGEVHYNLILCSITHQLLGISKGQVTWGGSVSLITGNYFHFPCCKTAHKSKWC